MSYDKHGKGMVAVNLVHNYLIKEGYQVFSEIKVKVCLIWLLLMKMVIFYL